MQDDLNDIPPALDLSALDPLAGPRGDALVAAIVADGMRARRQSKSVIGEISYWARPALIAAGVLIAASVPIAIWSTRELGGGAPSMAPQAAASPSVDSATRFGLPAQIVALAQRSRTPTPLEIVEAFNAPAESRGQ